MSRATSLAYFGPLFLLLSGCAGFEYTAADPSDAFAELSVSPSRALQEVPPRDDLVSHWQLPTESPWAPYEKLTLPSVLADASTTVSLPQIDELGDVQLARLAGGRVAADGFPPHTAWFVDLPGAASVAFAHALTNVSSAPIAVIPTFNNWPAMNELIPAEQTLAAMIAMPPRFPRGGADDVSASPIFLLDSWRLAYKEETIADDVVDNRYMLTSADLPSAQVLRDNGITEVVYVVAAADIVAEEDDLNELFREYEDAGIVIYLVDAGDLARDGTAQGWSRVPWYVQVQSHYFIVRPRSTVVRDPGF